MQGLVTLLPEPYNSKVNGLWDGLENEFNLKGIRITPFPHFSWNIAEEYARPDLDLALAALAESTQPLKVRTDGIGLFPAPVPVLFIRILREPDLDALHRQLWERMQPIAKGLSLNYAPDNWQPHITLAYDDLTSEMVPEVRAWLEAQEAFDWIFDVTQIDYIFQPDGQIGDQQLSFPLSG